MKIINSMSKNNSLIIYNIDQLTDNQKLYFGTPKNIFMSYLIGCDIDNSILLMNPSGININGKVYNEVLFKDEQNDFERRWEGKSISLEEIENKLGIEKAISLSFLDYYLNIIFKNCDTLYILPSNIVPNIISDNSIKKIEGFNQCQYQVFLPKIYQFIQKYGLVVQTNNKFIDRMREVKDSLEIAYTKKAIDISIEGHLEAMRRIKPAMTEYQLAAITECAFRCNGATGLAYKSIVATGKNAHILHRRSNLDTLQSGDLVLIDCGAEYNGYCADITRTIPVSGKFSDEQKIIYNIVLEAVDSAISVCKKGKLFMLPHQKATKVIKKRLKEIGIIKNESDFTKYFYHGTSHYIGLEVHDVGSHSTLEAGNIITIEPGIYIPEGSPCDSKWWRICIRIEENVLITNDYPTVLSAHLPRKIDEIEKIMNNKE